MQAAKPTSRRSRPRRLGQGLILLCLLLAGSAVLLYWIGKRCGSREPICRSDVGTDREWCCFCPQPRTAPNDCKQTKGCDELTEHLSGATANPRGNRRLPLPPPFFVFVGY